MIVGGALAIPANSVAQVGLGAHAGVVVPMGDFGDGLESGMQFGAELNLNLALIPVGLRFDLDYNRFSVELVDGSARVLSGAANGILDLPGVGISAYLLGGVGLYNYKTELDDVELDSDSQTDAGLQIGGGLKFGFAGLGAAAEIKLVNVFSEGESVRYLPLTVRVLLGS